MSKGKASLIAMAFAMAGLTSSAVSGDDTVQGMWRAQRFSFPFISHATSYNCVGLTRKIAQILKIVGAHPKTKVRVAGCSFDRPANNLHVTIDTAIAVLAPPKKPQATTAAAGAEYWGADPFPAAWRSINLSRDRRTSLRTGDCQLVQTLTLNVFSQMSVSLESTLDLCSPDLLSPRMEDFSVNALVPVGSEGAGPS